MNRIYKLIIGSATVCAGILCLSAGIKKVENIRTGGRKQLNNTGQIINIPVLFHIIHGTAESECFKAGEGANEDQNLSRQLVLSELKNLHDDFLLLNKDTSEVIAMYKGLIANPKINFYLDTTYKTGSEPGIIRVQSDLTSDWTNVSPVIEPKKYLNVYVVNYDHSYTSDNHVWDTPDDDAIYLYYCWVGRDYRLLTHETGHWLGLLHLWGTGDGKGDRNSCKVGDGIEDTHPQKKATDGKCDFCPDNNKVKDQSCDNLPSNYNNYMDYSGCRKMFTKGQVQRMRENLFAHRQAMVENSTMIPSSDLR